MLLSAGKIYEVIAAEFDLTRLPEVMDAKNWSCGASLMRRWFKGSGYHVAPQYGRPDTTTIKMDWLLKFSRAEAEYKKILKEKIYYNTAAQNLLRQILAREGLLQQALQAWDLPMASLWLKTFDFCAQTTSALSAGNAERIDSLYVNNRGVESSLSSDPLDDLFAALASYTLRVTVKGHLTHNRKISDTLLKYGTVTIEAVGVYVRDTYDFNDTSATNKVISQPLGWWSIEEKDVAKWAPSGGNPLNWKFVQNSDFRDWRKEHKKGGDFLVYSDVKCSPLEKPASFDVLLMDPFVKPTPAPR